MTTERVRDYLRRWNRENDILEPDVSTATVELAAAALGTEPRRIAKTLSFQNGDSALLVVMAGDARVDNRKFREQFGFKPRMLGGGDALRLTGFAPGGVCPFALPEEIPVYLDESLRRFETIFPACGTPNSAIELTCRELEQYSLAAGWVDVCKIVEES